MSVFDLDSPTIGDFVAVRHFPTVIQAADIRALYNCAQRDGADATPIGDFTSGYLDGDDATRATLERALRALSGTPNHAPGGAWFINGVFGSGKSHLLGLLGLLASGFGQRAFAQAHPHLKTYVGRLAARPWLCVHIALDEYEAANWSLEAIFWRELELQWQAHDWPDFPAPDTNASRRDHFEELFAQLQRNAVAGIVICWDELSLFLAAREHQSLQGDAAWLQFLGQRARPRELSPVSTCSDENAVATALCVFATLQKSVDDIGGIAPYSLQQIRDRYTTLHLACAQIPQLIEGRFLQRLDNPQWNDFARRQWENLSRELPRLEFGFDDWRHCFPFHPPVVALLEPIVSRWLSRTRSAMIFLSQSLDPGMPANQMIGSQALCKYLRPALDEHPELRPLLDVWRQWESDLPNIAQHSADESALRQIMGALICFKVAGIAPDAVQIANFIALCSGLPDDGVYQWTTVLLERLARRGGQLAIERRDGEWADRYTVDVGMRAGEAARRALQNALETLPIGDARIAQFAVEACRQPTFPLRELGDARAFSMFWQHAPRGVQVRVWRHESGASEWAINRLATLSQSAADWLLLLAPPLAENYETREAFAQLSETLRTRNQTTHSLDRERVVLWIPRDATDDEWQIARKCGQYFVGRRPAIAGQSARTRDFGRAAG